MTEPEPGPVLQSVLIGFRALVAGTAVLGAVWLLSGVRQVPPEGRAVVFRLGRVDRVRPAGLLLALPAPIETVSLQPGPERQLTRAVTGAPRAGGLDDAYTRAAGVGAEGGAGSFLTGDGGVVLLDATLVYRIADPAAYALAAAHVPPALDRLFRASAVSVAARHRLDDFLVASPGAGALHRDGSEGAAREAAREALRDELLEAVAVRLRRLDAAGAPLGVALDRLDLTAFLPPAAKLAFDAVLTATQVADRGAAAARTDAARTLQAADQARDHLLDAARAAATERVSAARTDVTAVAALEAAQTPATRDALVRQTYLDAAARVLSRAGSVTAVDPRDGGTRLVLPGAPPAEGGPAPAAGGAP